MHTQGGENDGDYDGRSIDQCLKTSRKREREGMEDGDKGERKRMEQEAVSERGFLT